MRLTGQRTTNTNGLVSIHAPREGCDRYFPSMLTSAPRFQFTHPGRGATKLLRYLPWMSKFQFTHPGRGATVSESVKGIPRRVSIHAPREGCDLELFGFFFARLVSIHAPREGCDIYYLIYFAAKVCFNSRTPGGVRPASLSNTRSFLTFQFTHPGRGATATGELGAPQTIAFQFTHPGRGATRTSQSTTRTRLSFNSRTPGGVRHGQSQ